MKCVTTKRSIGEVSHTGGFTLIELLVVISIIGILASLVVGVSGVAATKARLSQSTALLHNVSTAIDSYHADRGSYPPDSLNQDGTVNTVVNPLYYELTGAVYTDKRSYISLAGSAEITRPTLNRFFGRDGFQNVSLNQSEVKGYLD
ncbi:MAG: type II secretion system protein, partial [Verrucomicrobia bacterium]|nr:type II secretion system protein [Verrucomicrobiota bacterium]